LCRVTADREKKKATKTKRVGREGGEGSGRGRGHGVVRKGRKGVYRESGRMINHCHDGPRNIKIEEGGRVRKGGTGFEKELRREE